MQQNFADRENFMAALQRSPTLWQIVADSMISDDSDNPNSPDIRNFQSWESRFNAESNLQISQDYYPVDIQDVELTNQDANMLPEIQIVPNPIDLNEVPNPPGTPNSENSFFNWNEWQLNTNSSSSSSDSSDESPDRSNIFDTLPQTPIPIRSGSQISTGTNNSETTMATLNKTNNWKKLNFDNIITKWTKFISEYPALISDVKFLVKNNYCESSINILCESVCKSVAFIHKDLIFFQKLYLFELKKKFKLNNVVLVTERHREIISNSSDQNEDILVDYYAQNPKLESILPFMHLIDMPRYSRVRDALLFFGKPNCHYNEDLLRNCLNINNKTDWCDVSVLFKVSSEWFTLLTLIKDFSLSENEISYLKEFYYGKIFRKLINFSKSVFNKKNSFIKNLSCTIFQEDIANLPIDSHKYLLKSKYQFFVECIDKFIKSLLELDKTIQKSALKPKNKIFH
jgi:hypothetical protein